MDAVRVWLDDPRGPAAFLVAIALITCASLLAQRVRTARRLRGVGSRARRPWPIAGPAIAALPAAAPPMGATAWPALHAVPEMPAAPQQPDPVGTVLLAVAPDGPVAAVRPAELLGLEPGLQVRVRRADLDPGAILAALPDDAATLLDDLTAAPSDVARNTRFRRSVDIARPVLPCAVILAGPAGTAPVVTIGALALHPLLAEDPLLAALLAKAVTPGADAVDLSEFATALLAAVRACPIGALLDLDDLVTDDPWVAAHRADLRMRYGSFLGGQERSA